MKRLSQLGAAAGLLGLCLLLWALTPVFLTTSNLLNVLQQSAINGVLAVGMTLVILTGGIDLSVGSVLAASGVVVGLLLQHSIDPSIAVLAGLAVGGACGLVNGLLITMLDIPPFIATLGMMSAARGLALVWSGGRPIAGFVTWYLDLASSPWLIGINVVVYGFIALLLGRTAFGRYIYAVGDNEQAAWLSGVPTRRVKAGVYVLAGLLAGLAAAMLNARLNSAQPIAGVNYELDAIAAVVIGGTSLAGGQGSILGTLIGVLIMSVLRNGLNLLSVSADMQQVIIGVVIVLAVLVDRLRLSPPRWMARVRPLPLTLAGSLAMALMLVGAHSYRLSHTGAAGIRLAVVPKTLNNPFWVDLVDAAKEAGARNHVQIIVQAASTETDSEQQMRLVENLIQQHVSALILAPAGSKEIVPAIKEANEAGIPVLIIDTKVDDTTLKAANAHIETFIGSDNRRGGELAGECLAEALHDDGDVAVLEGFAGHETGDARKAGFDEAIAHHPGLHIVASQPANWEQEKAFNVTQNMLQAHPEIRGLFACNDVMALGASRALSASRRKDVLLVGFDASDDARKAIQQGTMLASVAQYPGDMGRIAVETAVSLLAGHEPPSSIPTRVEIVQREAPPAPSRTPLTPVFKATPHPVRTPRPTPPPVPAHTPIPLPCAVPSPTPLVRVGPTGPPPPFIPHHTPKEIRR